MVNSYTVKRGIVGTIIAVIFILAFLVLKSIMVSILFGLLFAYIFSPVYERIYSKIKLKSVSAFILLIGITFLIAIPMVYVAPLIVEQAFETFSTVQNFNFGEYFDRFFEGDFANMIALNLDNIIGTMFSAFLNQFTAILVNLPSLLLQFAVFLFTFFFAVRDSKELGKYISSLSPFSKSTEDKFLKEFRGITNAIIFGQVLIGIIQGIAVGAGLFFLGVPKALFLTILAALLSIIPVLGSWIVWLPTALLLLIAGNTFAGIFLLLYGALFVSTIDNFIRPYILSRQSNLPIVLSVIGTIGGLYFFGIAGLVLGPLILAYVLIIIEFYREGKLDDLFKK